MKRRLAAVLLAAAAVAAVACAAAGAWIWSDLHRPYASWSGDGVTVELPRGIDAGSALRRLADHGVLEKPGLVALWIRWGGGDEEILAGTYRFERPASPLEILEKLRRGEILLRSVTLPEGLTLSETAARIGMAGLAPEAELLEAMQDPGLILDLDPAASDLEGYLFPDTYRFSGQEGPRFIVETLVGRFREVTGRGFTERAGAAGLSLRETVTLASMIEKETAARDERGRISRVFHNRLDRGMLLQCDPTVIYAIRKAGGEVGRLTTRDLEFDSPWNTYRVKGLPPGPICSPGKESMEAAVDPAPGRELYFVASPDGGHRFSNDLESHLKAVRDWRNYLRSSR